MKRCTRCNLDKNLDFFPFDKRRNRHTTPCKDCRRPIVYAANKKWKQECTESFKRSDRKASLKKKYGLTIDQVASLWNSQEGKCAICTRPIPVDSPVKAAKPHIDHNHVTGVVRGLLCLTCNTGLGMFGDSLDLLEAARIYLLQRGAATVKGKTDSVPVIAQPTVLVN